MMDNLVDEGRDDDEDLIYYSKRKKQLLNIKWRNKRISRQSEII